MVLYGHSFGLCELHLQRTLVVLVVVHHLNCYDVHVYQQVERLAHNLNLQDSEIHRLQTNDPVLFGIRVLKAWKSNYPYDTPNDAKQKLTSKLKQSGLYQQAKRVQSLGCEGMLASFPGSPHVRTKNRKQRVKFIM